MLTGPRDHLYSSKPPPPPTPPPAFTDDNLAMKHAQLNDLLKKLIDKYQFDSETPEQQTRQTDLLVAVAQFILSPHDKRDFLSNVVTIGQDLLTNEYSMNRSEEIPLTMNSNHQTNQDKDETILVPTSNAINSDNGDGEFSLSDLASEYLQDEPSPSTSNEKSITPTESEESGSLVVDLSSHSLSSSPASPSSPSTLAKIVLPSPSNEPLLIKPPLESILFTSRLSSQDAADEAHCIWKEESSPLGQLLCTKTIETQTQITKRVSTCLFDRNLYERLTHLIRLLPKQCIRSNVQQFSIRQNSQQQQQQHKPHRSNNDNRRPSHRATFQQNLSQVNSPIQGFPGAQNSRQYVNANYSNQQGNPGGYFVDRRQPQQQQHNRYPPPPAATQHYGNQYQQNRHPNSPSSAPYPSNQQQRRAPRNNAYSTGFQAPNDYQHTHHQQGAKKTSGGGGGSSSNKLMNEKSGVPGSGPSLNPR
ncbi:unnamed protein product [Rotaria socialis]|uniref:Uncharacterized protein n=2 Tax=Rotaria socialis TaxID=392032 RepID=A0A817U0F6_9BILA|nr:unnamed protein product [Rotaria socialis]CAF3335176.1 unnamed protein product [Rotaria socialis]CAF3403499.1 unnamed protein product [Rotaria socialis]CAF4151754.1 unnamed protein product [Rotaria socialis]CAF4394267.1 unnamed protein product [Rotaria socialis]